VTLPEQITQEPPPPVNVSPIINSFTGIPANLNDPGETITLNAFATDEDGDSLTYTITFGRRDSQPEWQ